jgi:hypothetical protein
MDLYKRRRRKLKGEVQMQHDRNWPRKPQLGRYAKWDCIQGAGEVKLGNI